MSPFDRSTPLFRALLAVPLLMMSSIGSVQADEGRTIITHVTTFDASRVTNALLFSKHTCQFHPEAEDSTVRILFTNAGVLNALNDIKHPKNRVPTLPSGDDDPKTAKRLLRKLLGDLPVNPPLLCNVEVVATGLGLKTYGKTADDLIDGVLVGGPTTASEVQVPVFLTTPAEEGQTMVVIDW